MMKKIINHAQIFQNMMKIIQKIILKMMKKMKMMKKLKKKKKLSKKKIKAKNPQKAKMF